MKKITSVSFAMLFGIMLSLVLLEVILKVFDPFPASVRGDKIVLKKNEKKLLKVKHPKLASEILVTSNNIGLRGEDYPSDPQNRIKIFTLGGSTTYSLYNGDGKTWSDLIAQELKLVESKVWVNNAGFSGHSTKGHLIMLKDHLQALKPDYAIFLIGINDVGRVLEESTPSYWEELLYKSEVVSFFVNIVRNYQSKKLNLSYDLKWDLPSAPQLELSGEQISKTMMEHSKKYLPFYRRRVESLVRYCLENKIKPILMTQPLVYGKGIDPTTGVNLEKVKVGDQNSLQLWLVLEMYNDVTRIVARKEHLPLIDLARLMPKDSHYYYDYMHYTDAGAKKVAELILPELKKLLRTY